MMLDRNTNILIIGLGMMGGGYAMNLSEKGYKVRAITKEQADIDYALSYNMIEMGTTKVTKELVEWADLAIFALYPATFIDWIYEYGDYFTPGTIVTDVTGVKRFIIDKVTKALPKGVEFIAAHPMAGREKSGVRYARPELFSVANYIITPTEHNSQHAINICHQLGETLGFARISKLSPEQHDDMIAFLSQLTHCIAVSLMCAKNDPSLVDYTGDSFRDLTRIASINDEMWSELFLENKDVLLREMDAFKESFDKLYDSLKNDDREGMRKMMRTSTERRAWFNK